MQLTQKETSLLKDLKGQEQTCVEKYGKYASDASDQQLKALFTKIGQDEKQHLNTISQIMNGTVPAMSSGSNQQAQQNFTANYNMSDNSTDKKEDAYLCTDLLSTEKHVSATYNTSIFEFKDPNIRDSLNHIQKEEQQHGEQIYDYMAKNGMYS